MESKIMPAEIIKQELLLTADAIIKTADKLSPEALQKAFELIVNCPGKVVVTGLGKTGIIARKISATLSSTGTTSIFLHAADGVHGDIGMIQSSDVVIAVSHSGSTQEMLSVITYAKFIKVPIIALTGNLTSPLAESSDVILDCSVPKEIEPFGLVPTASTTVALAVGDALAVALLKHKNFAEQDFAKFHPGGTIGKKLLLRVSDLMHSGDALPVVSSGQKMPEVIMEMTGKKLGCTAIVDEQGCLVGMITDGDLRRQLQIKQNHLLDFSAAECMTMSPKHAHPEELAVNALNLMESHKITMLPVLDADNRPVGMLHMHDLIQAGII
ncbi:MAG: KpsF/GutQ family sugar-phosphate isomerase [Candidatus Cloacimonadaceae bacterium]